MVRKVERQAVRYAFAGAIVGATYVGLTLALAGSMGLPIQVAIPLSLGAAVALHYLLQRHFVFAHVAQFALSTGDQIGRYALIGLTQYGTTAAAAALLPDLLAVSERAAYVGTVVVLSVATFLLLRTRVFHPGR